MFELFANNRENSPINFENIIPFVILDLIKVQVIMFGDICKRNTVKLLKIVENAVYEKAIKITRKNCQVGIKNSQVCKYFYLI